MGLFGPPNVKRMKAKSAIKGLIKALGYQKDARIREAAAVALGQLGDASAVEPLIATLKDSNSDVCRVVADALVKIGTLKDSAHHVRVAIARALGQIGDDRAIEPFIVALKHNEWRMREAAAGALDTMGWRPGKDESGAAYWVAKGEYDKCISIGAPAIEPLMTALQDDDRDVRGYVVDALVKIGKPAIEPLIASLKDSCWDVREVAVGALEPDALYNALKNRGTNWHILHRTAACALGQIGDDRAVEPLIVALKDRGNHWHNLHEAMIYALWNMSVSTQKSFIIALKECREDMDKAADALTKIGKPAVEPLIIVLKNSDCCVGEAAAGALDTMGWRPGKDESGAAYWVAKGEYDKCISIGAPAIEPLMARLKERTRHWRYSRKKIDGLLNQQRTLGILPKDGEQLIVTLREYWEDMNKAADALVKVGKPSVSILIAALEDGDEYVRTLAKGALVKIDTHTLESSIIAGSETVSTIPSSGEHPDGKTTGFTIRLVNSGNMKINVIKIIREVTGLGLQEAKEIADGVSNIVKANLSMDEATAIKMKFEEVGAKVAIVTSAGVISSRSKKTVTTIFGFFTRTKGEALVISLWDDEKWKNTLRTRLGLSGADVILFEEKDWLIPELKSKSIDELKKKYSLIISTIKKKLLLQGVPENVIDEVMKKAEVIPNPITGLVVFVIAYSGDFENNNY